jgi:chromosomal replication initiation ATPase DnaA
MKSEIFDRYTDLVCKRFDISREMLFSKTKKREIVDARQLLFFLCYNRPMSMAYIQKFMLKGGLNIAHTSIIKGIRNIEDKLKYDEDYISVVTNLVKSVTIQ